jgi:hypothetical protein
MNDRLHNDLADLADQVAVVDLRSRALRTSRRITLQRRLTAVAAAVAVIAIGAGGAFAFSGQDQKPVPAGSTSPSPSTSPSGLPSAQPSGSVSDSPSAQGQAPSIYSVDIRNATIVMPDWPHFDMCQSGPHKFVDGESVASKANGNEYDYDMLPAPVTYADLDGQPGDEALVTVQCTGDGSVNPSQLLALKPKPDGTLGVLGAPNTSLTKILDYDLYDISVSNRVVSLETMGPHTSNGGPAEPKQLHGYRYDDGAFHQVSGSTQDAAWPNDIYGVDLGNSTLSVNDDQGFLVRFVNGTGKQTNANGTYTFTLGPVVPIQGDKGENADVVLITRQGPGGTKVALFWVHATGSRTPAAIVVHVGDDGITGITGYFWDFKGGCGGLFINVTTASGKETRRYVQESSYNIWFHNEMGDVTGCPS